MSRIFINGLGVDSSLAARTFLAANRQLALPDLYVISTAPNYAGQPLGITFLLTDYPSPLVWSYKGTFAPANIKRGEVESKIGLEAGTLDVTWSPQGFLGTLPISIMQAFRCGIFDNGNLEVWRCVMQTPGDANTLGACCLFAGRIGDIAPDRLKATLTCIDRRETLNVQVPTVTIEPGNIFAQYSTGMEPAGGPPRLMGGLAVAPGSTTSKLYAAAVPAGYPPIADLYADGYLIFTNGLLGGHYVGVTKQAVENGLWTFYLEQPLPFAPNAGDIVNGYVPAPPDMAGAAAAGTPGGGFPYAPVACNTAMLLG